MTDWPEWYRTPCGHTVQIQPVKSLGGKHEGKLLCRVRGPQVEKKGQQTKTLYPPLPATLDGALDRVSKFIKCSIQDFQKIDETDAKASKENRTVGEQKILDYVKENGFITASDVEIQCKLGVNRTRVTQLLTRMSKLGMLEKSNKSKVGRKQVYALPDAILPEDIDVVSNILFDPALVFISGPTTTNLVMSFFLSNPKSFFSREDVFVHINRHCEEMGLGIFFKTELGYQFSNQVENPLDRELLWIGKSAILRTISNLEKTRILESKNGSQFRLSNNGSIDALRQLIMVARNLETYYDFTHRFQKNRLLSTQENRKKILQTFGSLDKLISGYVRDLIKEYDGKKRCQFFSRLARLSHFCEIYGVSFSTVDRKWKDGVDMEKMHFVSEIEESLKGGKMTVADWANLCNWMRPEKEKKKQGEIEIYKGLSDGEGIVLQSEQIGYVLQSRLI